MKTEVSQRNEYLVLSLIGRLDTVQAPALEKKMLEILDQGHDKIILDCKEMDYISSSGLRIFLIAQKRMMGISGILRICNLQSNIGEVFEISGFSLIFSIYPDLETAIIN